MFSSPAQPRATAKGSRSGNLFLDADAPTEASPTVHRGGRRGRGLVVTVDDSVPGPREPAAARFTRASSGWDVWPALAGQRMARNAQRLLQRFVTQRYGALVAFIAAAALPLAVSLLALSLSAAASDRDRLRDQRDMAMHALDHARADARDESAA
jgi:hypothetical protein